jgi:hypothetical protein
MNRRIAIAAVIAAVAAAALWQTHAGAAAKKPVALQYDTITRIAYGQKTPPPPGAFADDYAAIMSGVSTETASATAPQATPTPAPRKRGLFSQISQIVTNGVPGGDNGNGQGDQGNPYASAMNQVNRMQLGTLVRLTYYKNWLRTDDPVDRTATISKCDLHQYVTIDYAHRTYSITNTAPKCAPAVPAAYKGPGRTQVENEDPGTGDVTFTATSQDLGPKTLDGIPTVGRNRAIELASTNSTGSCKNSDMKMQTLAYVSQIVPPRAYCPLPRTASAPYSPESVVVHGGCKPRMHGSASGAGFTSNTLEMYMKMTMGTGQGGAGFASVTERGNVKWLMESAAEALFSVPAGFTKQ